MRNRRLPNPYWRRRKNWSPVTKKYSIRLEKKKCDWLLHRTGVEPIEVPGFLCYQCNSLSWTIFNATTFKHLFYCFFNAILKFRWEIISIVIPKILPMIFEYSFDDPFLFIYTFLYSSRCFLIKSVIDYFLFHYIIVWFRPYHWYFKYSINLVVSPPVFICLYWHRYF